MPTYRLLVEYDGTRYRGWQEQTNARTVAGELRAAVERVAGRVSGPRRVGRTDAGSTPPRRRRTCASRARWIPRTCATRQRAAAPRHPPARGHDAPERFHARHAARLAQLRLSDRDPPDGVRQALRLVDQAAARRRPDGARRGAATRPARLHALLRAPAEQTSTLVVVERAEVARAGGLILCVCAASHFLWKMVRRIVGTLVEIGAGRLDPEDLGALSRETRLARSAGTPAEWTAPPSGLFLERVLYPAMRPSAPWSRSFP
jgi:tRNA pseudouridine38-40 synthase